MADPTNFREANKVLGPPPGDRDDTLIDPLPIFTDGKACVSKWKLTWRERWSALFFGHAWVWVLGPTQPPVALDVKSDIFKWFRAKKVGKL